MSHTLGAAKTAAGRIGCDLDTYQRNRAAGLRWCSGCREWRERASGSLCQECRRRYDRERKHRRAFQRTSPLCLRRSTVVAARAASSTAEEMASLLGCSTRSVRRLVHIHELESFKVEPVVKPKPEPKPKRQPAPKPEPKLRGSAPHPPQRWCSCEWCERARRAA